MSFSHYRPILAGGVVLSLLLLPFNQPVGSLISGVHAASAGDQSPAEKPASRRAPESASASDTANTTRRVVQQGVAVEFSLQHVEHGRTGPPAEGDDVVFRFQITDSASGAPLSGLDPAGWMNRASANSEEGPAPATQDAPSCRKQVESFLSGGLLARADLDLNTYRVLTLNGDATIAAVDPLFGFGRTRLVGLVQLKSPGDDWVLKSDQSVLFVSVPDSDHVAVVDTVGMKMAAELSIGARPARLALQPDEHYLWVSYGSQGATLSQSGVAVVSVPDLRVVARIATGRGPHQVAFSGDDRFAFVTNREEGSTSVIDIRKLAKVKDIATGPRPSSVAFSALSGMAYVT
ncbi:MAG TPA: hypothetical protein VG778_08115, partial [Blastocatellia bacterium]|nr:hypothetical protein [Blastocatellia bacterium]